MIESAPVKPLLYVLTTGGTIDKTYFDALSEYQIGDSIAHKLLEVARVAYPFCIVEVLRKDSLEFTDEDRQLVRAKVEQVDSTRIVITHGTDTMTDTARALEGVPGKTIVLTGALSPARFGDSDASFNLGMAFAAAQLAFPGVYISMSGQVFKASAVRKDRVAGRFVATSD